MKVDRRAFLRNLGWLTGGVVAAAGAGAGLKFVLDGLDPRPPINKEGRYTYTDLSKAVNFPSSQATKPNSLSAKSEPVYDIKAIKIESSWLDREGGVVNGKDYTRLTMKIRSAGRQGWEIYKTENQVTILYSKIRYPGNPDLRNLSENVEIKIDRHTYSTQTFDMGYQSGDRFDTRNKKVIPREQKEYKPALREQIDLIELFLRTPNKFSIKEIKFLREIKQQLKRY